MESNQNLIRANKQPAYNAMKTDGAESRERRHRVSQTQPASRECKFKGALTPQRETLQNTTRDSHHGTQTETQGCGSQLCLSIRIS